MRRNLIRGCALWVLLLGALSVCAGEAQAQVLPKISLQVEPEVSSPFSTNTTSFHPSFAR